MPIQPVRAGRIPATSVTRRREALLATARSLFCELGFERTTIVAIAKKARVSTKTLYARYGNKEGVFAAAILIRADTVVEPLLVPISTIEELRASMLEFAVRLMTVACTREALMLQRIVIAEGDRFPDVAQRFLESGPRHGYRALSAILHQSKSAKLLAFADPQLVAQLFMGALLGPPATLAEIPAKPLYTRGQIVQRAKAAVNLFFGDPV